MRSARMKAILKLKMGFVGLLAALLIFAGCDSSSLSESSSAADSASASASAAQVQQDSSSSDFADSEQDEADEATEDASSSSSRSASSSNSSSSKNATVKNGVPTTLKGNWTSQSSGLYYTNDAGPSFSSSLKKRTKSFKDYSSLDSLGRCGRALALIGLDLMPTGGRESISHIKPTGWRTYEYDFINGGYLYNRCHLIAFSLAGENANERNLITGTRQMNEAMIMFESIVSTYVTGSGNKCLYRVTPIFLNDELVARGVQMEAYSVADNGARVKYNVYIPNKQENVKINYSTGESSLAKSSTSSSSGTSAKSSGSSSSSSKKSTSSSKSSSSSSSSSSSKSTYVLNTSSMKFHYSTCSSVKRMSDKNKLVVNLSRSKVISQGYVPCKICNP